MCMTAVCYDVWIVCSRTLQHAIAIAGDVLKGAEL